MGTARVANGENPSKSLGQPVRCASDTVAGKQVIFGGPADRQTTGRFSRENLHDKPCRKGIGGFPHMLLGYMRVSTDGDPQVLDLQRNALLTAGVDEWHLFEDHAGGSRCGSARALAFARSGDCLVVWKLDRLGRSLPDLLHV